MVSEAWVGRASDKHITLDILKKLLLNLESGDAVKADRGLTISIELEQKGIGKDRAQLTGQEVYKSRRVAEARQAIGKIKTFRIFSSELPLSLKPIAFCWPPFQTIGITRTLICHNTHDLNDTRRRSFIDDRTGTVVNTR